jgi:hypothetical protein
MDQVLSSQAVSGQRSERRIDPHRRRDNLFRPVHALHRTEGSFGEEARGSTLLFPAPATRLSAVIGGALAAGLVGAALMGSISSLRR